MGVLNGIRAAMKRFHDTWVSPKDERQEQPGALHLVTLGGKVEINAVIGSGTDARDIKNVLDLILTKCAEDEDFETFIGRTE